MLKFARNKLVTISSKTADTLCAHGVLEDDLYGLEVDVDISLPEMILTRVRGTWQRWTTPECPRALSHIPEAEGLRIDAGIEHKLQKGVGRTGCRHFAGLLIECVKSVREAVPLSQWQAAVKEHPELSLSDFLADPDRCAAAEPAAERFSGQAGQSSRVEAPGDQASQPGPEPEQVPAGMRSSSTACLLDLHVHSFPASSCASDPVEHVIQQAKAIGLDGICLTDHNVHWSRRDIEDLRQKHGYLILGGSEITTDEGHMLVFGLDRPLEASGIVRLEDLYRSVREAGAFVIAAHPFRGFLTFGVGRLGLSVAKAAGRSLFRLVDGVEILNGKVTGEENGFAAEVAAHLHLPVTGGSDAHTASEVGCYATAFEDPIRSEAELLEALHSRRFEALSFRGGIAENADRT